MNMNEASGAIVLAVLIGIGIIVQRRWKTWFGRRESPAAREFRERLEIWQEYSGMAAAANVPPPLPPTAPDYATRQPRARGLSSIAWAFWVFVILFFGVPLIGTTILMFTPQYKEQVKRDEMRRQVETTGVKMFTIMAPAGKLSPVYRVRDTVNFSGVPEDWVILYLNGSRKGVPIGPKFIPHVPDGIETVQYMAVGDMPVAVHVREILMGDQHVTASRTDR